MSRRLKHDHGSHDVGAMQALDRFDHEDRWFGGFDEILSPMQCGWKGTDRFGDPGLLVQANFASQWGYNHSGKGAAAQAIGQVVVQHNSFEEAGHAAFSLEVGGKLKEGSRGIDIGRAAGDITQVNFAGQWGHNQSGAGAAVQTLDQLATQHNRLEAAGDASFSLEVGGALRGSIRDIDIGHVAGEVIQVNFADQSAHNHSAAGAAGQILDQLAAQQNWLEAFGHASFSLEVEGNLGTVRDIDIGLIAGHIIQANFADQWGQNQSGIGTAGQVIDQAALQHNWLEASGGVSFSLEVEGNLGSVHGIDVGLIAGDITQSNILDQWASNGTGKGAAEQTVDQVALQHNWVGAAGYLNFSLVVEGSADAIYGIDVGLITGGITQTNILDQWAVNAIGKGVAEQTIDQVALQDNWLQATGGIDVTLVIEGAFHQAIHDIRIGLTSGDILQSNSSLQQGANSASGMFPTQQTIEQFITQANIVDPDGHEHIVITVDDDYSGIISDLEIGLVSQVNQVNSATQVAINAGGGWHMLG